MSLPSVCCLAFVLYLRFVYGQLISRIWLYVPIRIWVKQPNSAWMVVHPSTQFCLWPNVYSIVGQGVYKFCIHLWADEFLRGWGGALGILMEGWFRKEEVPSRFHVGLPDPVWVWLRALMFYPLGLSCRKIAFACRAKIFWSNDLTSDPCVISVLFFHWMFWALAFIPGFAGVWT